MCNKHSKNMGSKIFCDSMLSTHFIENVSKTFGKDGYENQCYKMFVKHFQSKYLQKHCQQMLFKHFMYSVYYTFHDECLKTIFQHNLYVLSYFINA